MKIFSRNLLWFWLWFHCKCTMTSKSSMLRKRCVLSVRTLRSTSVTFSLWRFGQRFIKFIFLKYLINVHTTRKDIFKSKYVTPRIKEKVHSWGAVCRKIKIAWLCIICFWLGQQVTEVCISPTSWKCWVVSRYTVAVKYIILN